MGDLGAELDGLLKILIGGETRPERLLDVDGRIGGRGRGTLDIEGGVPKQGGVTIALADEVEVGGDAGKAPFLFVVGEVFADFSGVIVFGCAAFSGGVTVDEFDVGGGEAAPTLGAGHGGEIFGFAAEAFFVVSADVVEKGAFAAIEAAHRVIDFKGVGDGVSFHAVTGVGVTGGMEEPVSEGVDSAVHAELFGGKDAERGGALVEVFTDAADPVFGESEDIAIESDEVLAGGGAVHAVVGGGDEALVGRFGEMEEGLAVGPGALGPGAEGGEGVIGGAIVVDEEFEGGGVIVEGIVEGLEEFGDEVELAGRGGLSAVVEMGDEDGDTGIEGGHGGIIGWKGLGA